MHRRHRARLKLRLLFLKAEENKKKMTLGFNRHFVSTPLKTNDPCIANATAIKQFPRITQCSFMQFKSHPNLVTA